MKENKYFLIIMAIIALVLGTLLVYYFTSSNDGGFTFGEGSGFTKENDNKENDGSSSKNEEADFDVINLGAVKDYESFFNVNKLLNNYYSLMTEGNFDTLLKILDESYNAKNKLNKNNIQEHVYTEYQDITFHSKTMYQKGLNGVMYYFVEGEEQLYDFANEILTQKENVKYLVTIDLNNKNYSITPITSNDIFTYASNYELVSGKKISNAIANKYRKETFDDEDIALYYISYFQTILYLDTEKAYNMLESSYKQNFADLEAFTNSLSSIYEKISTNIISYGAMGQDGYRTYNAKMTINDEITIYENGIMNLKVKLN